MDYIEEVIANGADEEKAWAELERTALELDRCLCRRVPLTVARRFSSSVAVFRSHTPGCTRFGVFRLLLELSLSFAKMPEGIDIFANRGLVSTPTPAINEANSEECLCGRLSEDFAFRFVNAVVRVRAAHPEATTYGVFLTMLSISLSFVEVPANVRWLLDQKAGRRTRKPRKHPAVRGV